MPADPAYLAVVRSAAAGLAAKAGVTIDEIEDLRIAVDEACALLLDGRVHLGESLTAVFTLRPVALDVHVEGPALLPPQRDSLAWTVLEALAGRVETGTTGGGSWILLSHVGGRRNP